VEADHDEFDLAVTSEEQSRRVEPDATLQERPKEQHVSHQTTPT
jgi:hypothetical protein